MNGWDNGRWEAATSAQSVTAEGAAWLASASPFPRSVRALWSAQPWAPSTLPCGTTFDIVNLPALFGRRVLDRMWTTGPGTGPVAAHRTRLLLFTRPGTAARLPALLAWEEWSTHVPPLLCHGPGDAVTIPPIHRHPGTPSHWVVAPDTRTPWLPTADTLLRACLRPPTPQPTPLNDFPPGPPRC
jgi:Bifunctional DNA primase/polymerase, N-terminal